MKLRLIFLVLSCLPTAAGPYPGVAGTTGSDAIHKDDPRLLAWATGRSEVLYGKDVDAVWRTPAKAYGKATGGIYDIVCLGNGGRITLYFPHPVRDGEGHDFAVFENSFSTGFLELAFVEVSSDGTNFTRFPSASLTQNPVGASDLTMDPTNLNGLAGKYHAAYGTPFDLAGLPVSPVLDKQNVRFIRIVDIIGNGNTKDSGNRPIYDPTPTIGSGGFDLEAVGVIHQNNGGFETVRHGIAGTSFEIAWSSNPGSQYRVDKSPDLSNWLPVQTMDGSKSSGTTSLTVAKPTDTSYFWRVVRLGP